MAKTPLNKKQKDIIKKIAEIYPNKIDFKKYLILRELEQLETKTALHNLKYGKI